MINDRTFFAFEDERGNIGVRLMVANGAVSRVKRGCPRRRGWVSFLLGVLVVVMVVLAIVAAARAVNAAPVSQTIGEPWQEAQYKTFAPLAAKSQSVTVRPGHVPGQGVEGAVE